jgi:GTP-binding protein EngB required for normal cell division
MQIPVRAALDRLGQLAGSADRATLAALRDRLDTTRLRVLVVGEAKRGKSTVVNALLGRAVLPAGVVPLTAVPATVVHAPPAAEGIEVGFTGGRTECFPLARLPDFGTERGNPANRRCVSQLTVRLAAPILARGLEIVDTPGTGSVHTHNTAAADAVLPSMDAAIFVLTSDPPVSASERDLLRQVAQLSVALFVVLNKADYLDADSLAEAAEFAGAVVAETIGRPERIYPASARAALDGTDEPGFAAFAADFRAFLDSGRATSVAMSVNRQARRIAVQLLDEVALAQHAARLPGEEAAAQLAAFARQLESVTGGRVAAEDRVSGQCARLLEELNASAEHARPRMSAEAGDMMASVLDGELGAASPGDIQRDGRARLTAIITAAVGEWRHAQARALEDGLRDIDRQLAAGLEADLATVRSAAADLLGVDLAVPAPGQRLAADLGFCYDLGEQVDQLELLSGAVRRRLPGEYGRRLARQRVLAEVPDMVTSQLGRARGDLQYRLGEAARRLLADVRGRYADSTQRLTAALERADRIQAQASGHGEPELAELAARERDLRTVLRELSAAATEPDDG